jgi:hypothetical protein
MDQEIWDAIVTYVIFTCHRQPEPAFFGSVKQEKKSIRIYTEHPEHEISLLTVFFTTALN